MSLNPVTWPLPGKAVGMLGIAALAGGITYGVSSHTPSTATSSASAPAPTAAPSPAAAPAAAPSPSAPPLATCTIYAQQHDARVSVAGGNGNSECNTLISDLSSGLAFWSYQPTVPSESGWGQVCDVFSGSYEAVVYDDGGQDIGQEVCSDFVSSGWTEQQQQGPLAAQLAQQLNQEEQAQASASAAQAQASAVSQAQQSLSNDVASLVSDASTLNNDTSLAGAVSQMKQDYGQEQADYKTKQSDSCDSMGGDADTVGGDADTVGGDLDTLNGDVTDLQNGDIQSVQTDLSNVKTALSTLQGLGASPDTDSSAAIAAGNKALASAASAIQWANQQGATINSEAQ